MRCRQLTDVQVQATRFTVAEVAPPPIVAGRVEFLRACFHEAFCAADALTDQAVSTTDLRPGERLELLVTAGSADEELYCNRLVFLRVESERAGSITWRMAIRTFLPAASPLSFEEGRPVLARGVRASTVFAPAAVAAADEANLHESFHVDELSMRLAWHIVSYGACESPLFYGAAMFMSAPEMLHGLGSAGPSGRFQADIAIGREVVFPDETYAPGELIPRRWAKPVRAFVAGVFGEDRSNEMPVGLRRTSAP
jgi:hypothetical protein